MSEICKKGLIFCGDIHGDIKKLVFELVERFKVTNSNVIVCGDFGVGFEKEEYYSQIYNKIKTKLENSDINIYVVRGNHDDPKYFNGEFGFNRLKFLKDQEIIELSGKTIYPIGGGVSMDQEWRIKENNKLKSLGSSQRVWWENEKINQIDKKNFPSKVDIIVSHDAPISFSPVRTRNDFNELSTEIWNDALDSRRYLDLVLNEVNASYWFHGHYHQSTSGSVGNLLYKGLDIMELYTFNII